MAWWQFILHNLALLYIPAGAAVIGLVLGRVIRGRPYIGRHIN